MSKCLERFVCFVINCVLSRKDVWKILFPCSLEQRSCAMFWCSNRILTNWWDHSDLFKVAIQAIPWSYLVVTPNEFLLRNVWLSLAPMVVLVKHMENLWGSLLDLSKIYLCLFIMIAQILDASVSSVIIQRCNMESFASHSWTLQHLHHCTDSLSW